MKFPIGGVRINTRHPQFETRAPAFRAEDEAGKWVVFIGLVYTQYPHIGAGA